MSEKIKPITPEEITIQPLILPDDVIKATNMLIHEYWNGKKAEFSIYNLKKQIKNNLGIDEKGLDELIFTWHHRWYKIDQYFEENSNWITSTRKSLMGQWFTFEKEL